MDVPNRERESDAYVRTLRAHTYTFNTGILVILAEHFQFFLGIQYRMYSMMRLQYKIPILRPTVPRNFPHTAAVSMNCNCIIGGKITDSL